MMRDDILKPTKDETSETEDVDGDFGLIIV